MFDGGEAGGEPAAHPLTRRLGGHQRGMARLQCLEFLEQRVELAVGHRRVVEHVVPELGVTDLLGEFGVPGGGLRRGADRWHLRER